MGTPNSAIQPLQKIQNFAQSSFTVIIIIVIIRYKARGGTGTTAPEEVNYDDTILKQKDGEEQKNKKPKGIKKLLSLNSPKP